MITSLDNTLAEMFTNNTARTIQDHEGYIQESTVVCLFAEGQRELHLYQFLALSWFGGLHFCPFLTDFQFRYDYSQSGVCSTEKAYHKTKQKLEKSRLCMFNSKHRKGGGSSSLRENEVSSSSALQCPTVPYQAADKIFEERMSSDTF